MGRSSESTCRNRWWSWRPASRPNGVRTRRARRKDEAPRGRGLPRSEGGPKDPHDVVQGRGRLHRDVRRRHSPRAFDSRGGPRRPGQDPRAYARKSEGVADPQWNPDPLRMRHCHGSKVIRFTHDPDVCQGEEPVLTKALSPCHRLEPPTPTPGRTQDEDRMGKRRERRDANPTVFLVIWWMSKNPYAAVFSNRVAAEAAANV